MVKNSYIEGTVRVRSTGTFENCEFNVFWVRVENESYVEGPVPKDIYSKTAHSKLLHKQPRYLPCRNIAEDRTWRNAEI